MGELRGRRSRSRGSYRGARRAVRSLGYRDRPAVLVSTSAWRARSEAAQAVQVELKGIQVRGHHLIT